MHDPIESWTLDRDKSALFRWPAHGSFSLSLSLSSLCSIRPYFQFSRYMRPLAIEDKTFSSLSWPGCLPGRLRLLLRFSQWPYCLYHTAALLESSPSLSFFLYHLSILLSFTCVHRTRYLHVHHSTRKVTRSSCTHTERKFPWQPWSFDVRRTLTPGVPRFTLGGFFRKGSDPYHDPSDVISKRKKRNVDFKNSFVREFHFLFRYHLRVAPCFIFIHY